MKIIGHILVLKQEEKHLINTIKDKFKFLGTSEDVIKNDLEHYITPHIYVDFADLNCASVGLKESALSWLKINDISSNDILFTYAKFTNYFLYTDIILKNAIKANFKDFFVKIDESINDYICNQYGVPVNFSGYNYYNLDNFNIKENVNYLLLGESKHTFKSTSYDINVGILTGSNKKKYLYNLIINKKILLITNPF